MDPDEFVEAVQPLLERQDVAGLCALIKSRWTCEQLRSLLHGGHLDAKKVALLATSFIGTCKTIPEIALELKHPDRCVNEMAEHALWSVWLRLGTEPANHELARGIRDLEAGDRAGAQRHFRMAIELCPNFAEAYNQRAIARYLDEEYHGSIADCERAVELMPCHFGALAGMGHSWADLGQRQRAIRCYERALEINPHLDCVRQSIKHLRGIQSLDH